MKLPIVKVFKIIFRVFFEISLPVIIMAIMLMQISAFLLDKAGVFGKEECICQTVKKK